MGSNDKTMDYTKVPTKEMLKDLDKEAPPSYGYGVRHVQLLIFFICITNTFVARGHLGVTVVAMTYNPSSPIEKNIDNLSGAVEKYDDKHHPGKVRVRVTKMDVEVDEKYNGTEKVVEILNNTKNQWNVYRSYSWSTPQLEMVLHSFFLGYFIMMFPGGMLCQRWGGKLPLQISLLINGIVSFATPWMAMWGGWKAVCGCRILQGMSQAGTFPSIQALLAKWVSTSELATMSSYIYTGTIAGTVIAFQLGGLLADSRWGWPSTFWVVGIICILSFIMLTIFGAASPQQHKSITEEEKDFISGGVQKKTLQKRNVPWKGIMKSKPAWGTFVAQVGSGVAFVFFFTQVPTFIHHIYGIDVKNSGLLSSLPYILSFFTSIGFGLLSDYCTNRQIVTVKTARRISNSISQFGIAIMLILSSFATNTGLAVMCLVLGMGLNSAIHTGWMVTHIYMAPNFTSTLMAVGNTLTNTVVLMIPVLVSYIVIDVSNPNQWRIMFGLTAALALICNAIFVIFVSTERQPWDSEDNSTPNENEIKDTKE